MIRRKEKQKAHSDHFFCLVGGIFILLKTQKQNQKTKAHTPPTPTMNRFVISSAVSSAVRSSRCSSSLMRPVLSPMMPVALFSTTTPPPPPSAKAAKSVVKRDQVRVLNARGRLVGRMSSDDARKLARKDNMRLVSASSRVWCTLCARARVWVHKCARSSQHSLGVVFN